MAWQKENICRQKTSLTNLVLFVGTCSGVAVSVLLSRLSLPLWLLETRRKEAVPQEQMHTFTVAFRRENEERSNREGGIRTEEVTLFSNRLVGVMERVQTMQTMQCRPSTLGQLVHLSLPSSKNKILV